MAEENKPSLADSMALIAKHFSEASAALPSRYTTAKAALLLCPSNAERWAALAGGLPDGNRDFLARAICCRPGDFRFHANLSNRCLASGYLPRAISSLKRAAILEPGFRRAYVNMAATRSRRAASWSLLSKAWVLGADEGAGLGMAERLLLGNACDSAMEVLSRVLRLVPECSEGWRLAGIALSREGVGADAERAYCRAILLDPASDNGYVAAASHFTEKREFVRAGRLLDLAWSLVPRSAAILINRSAILERTGKYEAALRIAKQLAIRNPSNAEIYFNCGTAYHPMGEFQKALACHARAKLIVPKDLRFRNNLSHLLLKTGDLKGGFEDYEFRWYGPGEELSSVRTLYPERSFDLPIWVPGDRPTERVLVWGEQGIGDEVWGLAYLSALARREEFFSLEIDSRLVPLVKRAFPSFWVIARNPDQKPDVSDCQAQIPLLSLPHALGLETEPLAFGYLRPDKDKIQAARERMSCDPTARIIGLGWRSDKPLAQRSFAMPIDRFSCLGDFPKVRFLPLQYDLTRQEWDDLESLFGAARLIRPDFDTRNDLDSLVTAIAAVDTLATIATSLVPFAMAAGTTSSVLLRKVQVDWRYTVGSDRSTLLPGAALVWPPAETAKERFREAIARQLPHVSA